MNLAKSFSIYTIASFLNKGLMALLVFFLSHYIIPEDNGSLSLYSLFIALMLPFVILGMPSSIMLEHSKLSESEFKKYFASSLALSALFFLALIGVVLLAGPFMAERLQIPFRFLLMGLLYSWFNLFQENLISYLRTTNKPMLYLWFSIVRDLIEVGLVIVLVIILKQSALGRIQAGLITMGVVFAYAFIYFYRKGLIHFRISKQYMYEELKFGFSQIFFQFNVFILMNADKYFINHFNPAEKSGLGIYFMSTQFAFIINVLVNAFFSAYQPQLYQYLANVPQHKYRILKVKYLFAGFLLIATLLLCALVPLAYRWFIDKSYHTGITYVAWNAFAFFFWGLYALLLGILYFYKKNKWVIALSTGTMLCCVLLNYFFVKNWGVMGACYANLITYIFVFISIVVVILQLKELKLPWLAFGKIFSKQDSN